MKIFRTIFIFILVGTIFYPLSSLLAKDIKSSQSLDKILAIVNDYPITEKEFLHHLEFIKMKYIHQNQPLPDEKALEQEALDSLININLQLQLAKQNQISVSDLEVKQALENIAAQNQLTLEQLREAVSKQGQLFEEYQNDIKQNVLLAKLQQNFVTPTPVTEDEIAEFISKNPQLQNRQYHLLDLKISLPETASASANTLETEKIKKFAEQLQREIKIGASLNKLAEKYELGEFPVTLNDLGMNTLSELPEIFNQHIVKMKPKDISEPISTPNGYHFLQLLAIQEDKQDVYTTQVQLRHILIKPDIFSGSFDEAFVEVKYILRRLRSGESFTNLAKLYSHDTKSAAQEGEIGWVNINELPPSLGRAAEKLKINQISEPIKSSLGWHIIQVLKRRQVSSTKELERKQIQQLLFQQKLDKQIQKWLKKLREQSYVKILDKKFAR